MNCYVLSVEPTGRSYNALIDFCCSLASAMMVVVRDSDNIVRPALDYLRNDYVRQERVTQWPGTTLLFGGQATVHWHSVTPHLQLAMKELATHLFQWAGNLPEDPCFFCVDGRVLLTTTSHERDAYLMLSDDEYGLLQHRFPELASLTRKEGQVS